MTSVLLSLAALAVIGGGSIFKGVFKIAFLLVFLYLGAIIALGS